MFHGKMVRSRAMSSIEFISYITDHNMSHPFPHFPLLNQGAITTEDLKLRQLMRHAIRGRSITFRHCTYRGTWLLSRANRNETNVPYISYGLIIFLYRAPCSEMSQKPS